MIASPLSARYPAAVEQLSRRSEAQAASARRVSRTSGRFSPLPGPGDRPLVARTGRPKSAYGVEKVRLIRAQVADSLLSWARGDSGNDGQRRVMQEALFSASASAARPRQSHASQDGPVSLTCRISGTWPLLQRGQTALIDPELMMRPLIVGYCLGIRSEHRLCEEVHLNLAYRWFCRLGLDGDVPDPSTSSKTATAVSVRAISCASCSRP